jgi:hypothetical protein
MNDLDRPGAILADRTDEREGVTGRDMEALLHLFGIASLSGRRPQSQGSTRERWWRSTTSCMESDRG